MMTATELAPSAEPWGLRLWLAVAIVVTIAICLVSYGARTWPMADDEVPTLVEMGLLHVDAQAFSVPADQIGRLPRMLPVWYAFQRLAFRLLPSNEIALRVPSVICAVLTSAFAFLVAARWRGLVFAAALALLMNASQTFVYLAQVDRFYSMPLLLTIVTLVLMWVPAPNVAMLPLIGIMTVMTVLSHNVTAPVFVLAFIASCALWPLGYLRLELIVRTGVAALLSILLYLFYLLPLARGWNSTGNPTPVLISFIAHLGIPTLALALLGVSLSVLRRSHAAILWSSLMFCGSLCLLQFTSMTWNPRYFLFFMPAAWVAGAHAVDRIGRGLGSRLALGAWLGCVMLLLMPNLLSHYADGSRHDYRAAAETVIQRNVANQVILSDDAETISYYLPENLRHGLFVRTKVRRYPPSEFFLITRSNAWTPLPRIPERQVELLAEIYRRRLDQFSHILRVYRIAPGPAVATGY